jgi:AcrR family transcriptional regulator
LITFVLVMLSAPNDLDASLDRAERGPTGSAARILGCAERLFAARGFDGVTTREVAAAAGVNISTLHFHWSNKRTLYEAVCRLQARQLLRFVERTDQTTGHEAVSPSDRIERWVDESVDLLIENPAVARLAWQSVSGQAAPDLPTLLLHDVAVFRRLQSEIGKAIGTGDGRDAALRLLALFYLAVGVFSDSSLQCAVLQGSVYESPELQQQVRKFFRRLTRHLLEDQADAGAEWV